MIILIDKMSVSISACRFVCDVRICIVATMKDVHAPFLQLSAVVLPPMFLQMVNEMALVESLNPQ